MRFYEREREKKTSYSESHLHCPSVEIFKKVIKQKKQKKTLLMSICCQWNPTHIWWFFNNMKVNRFHHQRNYFTETIINNNNKNNTMEWLLVTLAIRSMTWFSVSTIYHSTAQLCKCLFNRHYRIKPHYDEKNNQHYSQYMHCVCQ